MIDMSKTYKTEKGNEVRIYAVDCGGDRPVHGAYFLEMEDRWQVDSWTVDGKDWTSGGQSIYDLIEVQPVKEVWVNIYPSGFGIAKAHPTREDADMLASDTRIACIKVT